MARSSSRAGRVSGMRGLRRSLDLRLAHAQKVFDREVSTHTHNRVGETVTEGP